MSYFAPLALSIAFASSSIAAPMEVLFVVHEADGSDSANAAPVEVSAALKTLHEQAIASALNPLGTRDLLHRLFGSSSFTASPASNEESLHEMLVQAQDREASFDTGGSLTLRQAVLEAYDTAQRPTPGLRDLAVQALHAIAAAHHAEQKSAAASRAAKEALRRFPKARLDPARYPPAMHNFFAAVETELKQEPLGNVLVVVDQPGQLSIDHAVRAPIKDRLELALSKGTYRLWWHSQDGSQQSIAQSFNVGDTPSTVFIDTHVHSRMVVRDETLWLTCSGTCERWLKVLHQRAGVQETWLVHPSAQAASKWPVTELTHANEPRQRRLAGTSKDMARFSPLYLLPLGGGQFAQGRPIFGGAYLATQLTLGAWHLSSSLRHRRAVSRRHLDREPDLRVERNLSGTLFYSSLAASVLEALIVGLVLGE